MPAGREPTVRPDKSFPLAPALVFDEADERAPTGVGDRLGQSGVPHHALDMQVFDDDDLVLIDKAPGQLEQVVASSVSDTLMGAPWPGGWSEAGTANRTSPIVNPPLPATPTAFPSRLSDDRPSGDRS
jgi:hypothetical protein